MKNLLVLLGSLLLIPATIWGKVYNVANQDEFRKVAVVVTAGDEIVIADGDYAGWELTIGTEGLLIGLAEQIENNE
jgi:hypothetical protein